MLQEGCEVFIVKVFSRLAFYETCLSLTQITKGEKTLWHIELFWGTQKSKEIDRTSIAGIHFQSLPGDTFSAY